MTWRLAILAVAFTTCVAAAKPLAIELKWTPNADTQAVPAFELTGGVYSLKIEKLIDKRGKGRAVGENSEKKEPVAVVTASDVEGFVTEAMIAQSRRLGLDVSDAVGDRVLTGELLECWVRETHGYNGSVRAKLTLRDDAGRELWTGIVAGNGTNGGRSLKPLNYTETFTNAISDFVKNLHAQQAFASAMRKARDQK
jgi:hypothetical protein